MLLDNNRLQGDRILQQEYMPLTELATRWGTTRHFLWKRVKGGLSNAMKRAGVQWGIGRYLYKLPTTFAIFGADGRKTRIEGEVHRWTPPELEEEFLPPKPKKKSKETK